jgi:hypothetical protein
LFGASAILQRKWMQCNQRKAKEESAVAIDGIKSINDPLLIYFKLAISNTHRNPAVTWCQKNVVNYSGVHGVHDNTMQAKNWKKRVQDI